MKKKEKNKKKNRRKNNNAQIKMDEFYYPYQNISNLLSFLLSIAVLFLFFGVILKPEISINDLEYYIEIKKQYGSSYCIEYTFLEKIYNIIIAGIVCLSYLSAVMIPEVLINKKKKKEHKE